MGSEISYMDMKQQTNPLFDNQIAEATNVSFSLEQEKNIAMENVRFLKSRPKTIETLFPSSSG